MAWITRTDEELRKLGYSIPVFRAIEHAGGAQKVAERFGYKTAEAVKLWYRHSTRRVPADKIVKLCEMGGNKVKPAHILAAMEEKRAA